MNRHYKKDNTALMLAILKRHNACVEILLKKGADVNQCNNNGMTALMFAVLNNSSENIGRTC